MDITGPLKISVLDDENRGVRQLHVEFVESFRTLPLSQQSEQFGAHIRHLGDSAGSLPEDDRNRQGILLIQQFCEQIQPHIDAGEVPLSETIVIDLGTDAPVLSLTDLLN